MHTSSPNLNRQTGQRILIVRLSAHGDVMHTLPLLSAIKRNDPHAEVGWLIEASAAPLLENHPLIDRLHVSHRKRWLKQAKNPLNWPTVFREVRALIRELKAAQYRVSFDVQGLLKSAVWPFLAKIPNRYGFKATRENADVFYNHKLPPMIIRDSNTPAVERYLDFARTIGMEVIRPEFEPPPFTEASRQKVAALLDGEDDAQPLLVLAPFTRWPSKHWEPEYWVSLIRQLLALNVRLAILGSPADVVATDAILSALPAGGRVFNLVGKTDWPDLYALFRQTRLLIGLDSAPLHIADAVGQTEIIGLYGPTAPGRTGPTGERHMTLTTALSCQPCFERVCPIKTHDCMKQLTPEVVMAMVRKALGYPTATEAHFPEAPSR